jgi:hypothetical protein
VFAHVVVVFICRPSLPPPVGPSTTRTPPLTPLPPAFDKIVLFASPPRTSQVVGEAWAPDSAGKYQLLGFYTPSALVTTHEGRPRVIDLSLARAFAGQHQLSISLAAAAASSGQVQLRDNLGACDTADDMLKRLSFSVKAVVALPMVVGGGEAASGGTGCPPPHVPHHTLAVLIMYMSTQAAGVSGAAASLLQHAPATGNHPATRKIPPPHTYTYTRTRTRTRALLCPQ